MKVLVELTTEDPSGDSGRDASFLFDKGVPKEEMRVLHRVGYARNEILFWDVWTIVELDWPSKL
jgi:hypothetical protein